MKLNQVLGFYLNEEVYSKKDSIGLFKFDDYFKVYGTLQIKDYPADAAALKEMEKVLSGNFIQKNWDQIQAAVDELGAEIEIGTPTMVKNYNLNDQSMTFVLISKISVEGSEPQMTALTMNGFIQNDRMIWMAYYLTYEGKESIEEIQTKSNFILNLLCKAKA